MKKPSRDWKDTYRDALFQCPELRAHKNLLCLLEFIIHKTNSKLQVCWVSQRAMADVSGCKIRNIKKMLAALQGLNAIAQTRFSALPPKDQAAINAVAAKPLNNKSNVYYPCLGWATEILEDFPIGSPEKPGVIRISEAARKRGSEKAADRRRRYAPKDLDYSSVTPSAPDHEDYLFLNAVDENRGPPSTPIFVSDRGPPSTRRLIENNPAAISALNNGHPVCASDTPSSQENPSQDDSSSLSFPPMLGRPFADGDSAAVAPVARAAPLPGLGGAHPLTELGVAGARANERRAL